MPTYAILGTTGKTGSSLLTHLLQNPQNKIHAYVRSQPKLLLQFPHLDQNNRVQIFTGILTDIPKLASCISKVDAIFSVIGENENTPGLRVVQDSAHAIVAALCHLGCTNGAAKVPRVLLLSSATINPRMYENESAILHWILMTALSNTYADEVRAEEFLKLHQSWLKVTFVQPGGLVEDVQRGHAFSLDRKGDIPPFISYPDLAAGMIEIAETGQFEGLGVSVVPTSKDVKFEWNSPKQIIRGMVWRFAPSFGWALKYFGFF